jgi:hypothetical protein
VKIELSPYAPVRYQHEIWWKYAVNIARRGLVVADGRIASTLPDIIMSELVEPSVHAAALEIKREVQDQEMLGHVVGQFMAKAMEHRHWVPLVAQYVLCGRQIFDLADDVVDMLEQTDFGDSTLADWRPPFDSMFIRFGKREGIRIPFDDGFEYLDGAFVALTPWDNTGEKRIKIGFTTVKEDGAGVMMPGYFLDFHPNEQILPVRDAVESAMRRRLDAFQDDPSDDATTRALNAHRRHEASDAGEILRQAVALMVNSMFYLESVGETRKLGPGRDVPPTATAQWASATDRQKEKLKSKLLSEGYSAVYLMGTEYQREGVTSTQGHSTKRSHWRRGHWRMQPHGQGRALVKRIWMKPQMIAADRVQDDMPGHVYVVGGAADDITRH